MNPLTPFRPTLSTSGSRTPGARRGLAVFALLTLSCVAPVTLFGCKRSETAEQQVELPPPINVDSVAASELTIPKKLSLTGTLRGQQETRSTQESRFAQTYLVLGNLYSQQGKKDKALEAWRKGASLFPNSTELRSKLQ